MPIHIAVRPKSTGPPVQGPAYLEANAAGAAYFRLCIAMQNAEKHFAPDNRHQRFIKCSARCWRPHTKLPRDIRLQATTGD